ncbi:MAG: hypothetical protein H7196_05050 [candidate division SR1 bacterium]|nr:hypothetical protein [candidate division SR1 bacterium]
MNKFNIAYIVVVSIVFGVFLGSVIQNGIREEKAVAGMWTYMFSDSGSIMNKQYSKPYLTENGCEAAQKLARNVGIRTMGCRLN